MTLSLHCDPAYALLLDARSFHHVYASIEERRRLHLLVFDMRIIDGVAELNRLIVSQPGQGYGTVVMEELCRWADENGFVLALTPVDGYPGTELPRLEAFYRRFGFVDNEGKAAREDILHTMYRPAKKGGRA